MSATRTSRISHPGLCHCWACSQAKTVHDAVSWRKQGILLVVAAPKRHHLIRQARARKECALSNLFPHSRYGIVPPWCYGDAQKLRVMYAAERSVRSVVNDLYPRKRCPYRQDKARQMRISTTSITYRTAATWKSTALHASSFFEWNPSR